MFSKREPHVLGLGALSTAKSWQILGRDRGSRSFHCLPAEFVVRFPTIFIVSRAVAQGDCVVVALQTKTKEKREMRELTFDEVELVDGGVSSDGAIGVAVGFSLALTLPVSGPVTVAFFAASLLSSYAAYKLA